MTDKESTDVWRDTPVRYLGYANEIGESFKSFLPRWAYLATYGVAVGYVSGDTLDKSEYLSKSVVAGDVFLWQMLASVRGARLKC